MLDLNGEDVQVDYRGLDVTVHNFLAVLTGQLTPCSCLLWGILAGAWPVAPGQLLLAPRHLCIFWPGYVAWLRILNHVLF